MSLSPPPPALSWVFVVALLCVQAASFPRLLLEFVINLTNDISTSPVRLNGMKIPHLWNTPRQVGVYHTKFIRVCSTVSSGLIEGNDLWSLVFPPPLVMRSRTCSLLGIGRASQLWERVCLSMILISIVDVHNTGLAGGRGGMRVGT